MLHAASPPYTLKKVDVEMLFMHADVRSLVESSRQTHLLKLGTVAVACEHGLPVQAKVRGGFRFAD